MAAKPKVKPGEPKGLLISKLRQAMLESQGNFGEMIRYLIYIYIYTCGSCKVGSNETAE